MFEAKLWILDKNKNFREVAFEELVELLSPILDIPTEKDIIPSISIEVISNKSKNMTLRKSDSPNKYYRNLRIPLTSRPFAAK